MGEREGATGGADAAGKSFTYGFDAMGRPNTMTQTNNGTTNWITGVTYNELGLPTQITAGYAPATSETRQYNVLGQLTKIAAGAYEFRYRET